MSMLARHAPTLEAALSRFDRWWQGLSGRERVLVGILATLAAVVALTYGVVKPIQAARADARADIRRYETLNARIRAAGTLSARPAPIASGPPATVLTSAASARGFVPTVAESATGIRATIADARYDALLAWLDQVTRTSTLTLRSVRIERTAVPGHVAAVAEFGQ